MIGVCIKYYHENYGGMLQAYATISLLEMRGLEYELIQNEKTYTPIGILKALPRIFNGILLNDKYELLLKKIGMKRHPDFVKNHSIRTKAFSQFRETRFTRLSPVFTGYRDLCEGAKRYSAVLTGSDQLWSPAGLPTNFYNLRFVSDDIRKISYASSFGVSSIPWYQKKRTAQFLKRIEYISMRENRGSEIVQELTGRTVPTILDPVFMFDKAGWEKLIPAKEEMEGPYLFAYFLGDNPAYRSAVEAAAKKLNCKIVALRHLDRYVVGDENFGDIALYDVAPDRFLNLLRGAAYICTDSFHGSCFSIIHHKSFITFDRYVQNAWHSKNSRIDTLCGNLCLRNRRFTGEKNLWEQLNEPIDYDTVQIKLNMLKQHADQYLDEAFMNMENESRG